MSAPTRYCESCAALLPANAVLCGECGARYAASPYERHGTAAPASWAPPVRARSRDLAPPGAAAPEQVDGIELISRDALVPREPGATTIRPGQQYDRAMVAHHPPLPVTGAAAAAPALAPEHVAAPAADRGASATGRGTLEYPLDGCRTAPPLRRALAELVDVIVQQIVLTPLLVAITLFLVQDRPGSAAQILFGVGMALPTAYLLFLGWLHGTKGFTVGKAIFGLRTARMATGTPIGFLGALGRGVIYNLIAPLMALSIFIDPRNLRRGFHDRAADSVVVDAKDGRHPFHPRPDDFQRPGAEHYMPFSSVAVDAHPNLLAEPGSPWSVPSAPEVTPPPQQPSNWEPAPAQSGTGSEAWAPPPTAPATGEAGDDADVDEQTRLAPPDDAHQEGLDRTRLTAVPTRRVRSVHLVMDDGAEHTADAPVVIGRNPSAPATEEPFVLKDETRSVSKTHALLDGTGEEITVTDLGSTNGSAILTPDGSRRHLVAYTPTVLPTGARLALGDRTMQVGRQP